MEKCGERQKMFECTSAMGFIQCCLFFRRCIYTQEWPSPEQLHRLKYWQLLKFIFSKRAGCTFRKAGGKWRGKTFVNQAADRRLHAWYIWSGQHHQTAPLHSSSSGSIERPTLPPDALDCVIFAYSKRQNSRRGAFHVAALTCGSPRMNERANGWMNVWMLHEYALRKIIAHIFIALFHAQYVTLKYLAPTVGFPISPPQKFWVTYSCFECSCTFFGAICLFPVVGRHFIAVATAAVKWPGNDLMRKVRLGQNLKFIPARQVRAATERRKVQK